MVWLFKIQLLFGAYAKEEWEGEIEIESSDTREDLHFAIISAVGFDNDHLYEFCISRTERSRDRLRFDDDNGEIYNRTIESLYPLGKGRKIFYLFDYGDHWLFKITKSREKPQEKQRGQTYPKLVSVKGRAPEQYPIWDE